MATAKTSRENSSFYIYLGSQVCQLVWGEGGDSQGW